jgi:hypothetical protein
MEVSDCNCGCCECFPLYFCGHDVDEDCSDDVQCREVCFIHCQSMTSSRASIMAAEDDFSRGGDLEDGGHGFEEGAADCFSVVLVAGCADTVAWKFGDEEGDLLDEFGDNMAPDECGLRVAVD